MVMSQETLKLQVCKDALEICRARREVLMPELFHSIESQLIWLIAFFEGKNSEREKLFQLSFGLMAVREIDPSENELISSQNKAFYVATKTGKGLKIEPKVIGFDS